MTIQRHDVIPSWQTNFADLKRSLFQFTTFSCCYEALVPKWNNILQLSVELSIKVRNHTYGSEAYIYLLRYLLVKKYSNVTVNHVFFFFFFFP
jgi:hypothetical protein